MPYRADLDGLPADRVFFREGGGEQLEPGDWAFDDDGVFCARLPCGDAFRNHGAHPWAVAGERGAPSLSPSIHCSRGEGKPREWHGFLTGGQWREC